jgi:hypothetical protein
MSDIESYLAGYESAVEDMAQDLIAEVTEWLEES